MRIRRFFYWNPLPLAVVTMGAALLAGCKPADDTDVVVTPPTGGSDTTVVTPGTPGPPGPPGPQGAPGASGPAGASGAPGR